MSRHHLVSSALLFGVVLVAACADQPETHHPTAETPIAASIVVGGLTFDRVVVDPNSPLDPWMKNIGPIDGDALPDLLVSGANGPLVWYQAPNWTKRTIAATASSESGSDVGDIDGDGDVDVVVGKTWYENIGGGSSWSAHPLPSGSGSTHDIVVADVNGDGRLDIAMRGQSQTVVTVYQQNSPTSWTVYNVQPGIGLNGLDVADVNADGRADIVVGGIWMENPGGNPATGSWAAHTFAPNWNTYASVKVIDMDGDGRRDIVLSVSEAQGKLSWFKAPADPENGSWQENIVDTGLNKVHCFAVVDLNGDGLLDIAASEFEGEGRLILYLRTGGGGFSSYVLGRDALHNMRAGDIDADGDIDLFGAYCYGVTPVLLYRNVGGSGGGSSTPPTVASGADANPSPVTGTTATVSALGADDGGEPSLRYTWTTSGTPPGSVSFSPNGTNAARSSVATFTRAGSYTLQVTITDAQNQSVLSSVAITVAQSATSVAVTPAAASVSPGGTQAFAASVRDQFAQSLTSQPSIDWTVNGGGTISGGGFTAGASAGGPFTVTASGAGKSGTASVTVTAGGGGGGSSTLGETSILATQDGGNGGVLVAQQATLAQGGTLQTLSFYVTTAAGQLRLGVYSANGPSGGPGTKVAETAAFTPVTGWNTASVTTPVALPAGTYWLAYLASSNSLQFRHATSGAGRWYSFAFGALPTTFASSPSSGAYHWSLYGTLGTGGGGPVNQAPTVANTASASPATLSGTSTALSVLGADDAGEPGLRYTWATTGTPPASVSFSPNGSNAARATTASFTRAGSYTLQAVITDAQGLSVSSSVTVLVTQALTTVQVTPASPTVPAGGTAAFTASARDQFAQPITPAPSFSWTVNGGGTISAAGQFTAGPTAGGPFTVTAVAGTTSGTASVTITASGGGGTSIKLGESAILAGNDGNNGGLIVAQQATLSSAATLQSLSFYVTAAAGKLRLGLYRADGAGGGPGTRVAETAEFTPVIGWNTASVQAPVSLATGTYWLAYLSNSNSLGFRSTTSGAGRWKAVTYGPMPATFPTQPSSGSYHWSFYATLQ